METGRGNASAFHPPSLKQGHAIVGATNWVFLLGIDRAWLGHRGDSSHRALQGFEKQG